MVNRGCGSGRAKAGEGSGPPAASTRFADLAQFGLGQRELKTVELVVEQTDLRAVSNPERGEAGLCIGSLGAAFAEESLELGQPRTQPLEVVVVRAFGSDEGRHITMISNW